MKKQKFNPELLKEELNRFKLLEGYSFYQEEKVEPKTEKPLILGTDLEEEDDNAAADEIGKDLGVDKPEEAPVGEPQDGPAPPPPAPNDTPPPPPPAPATAEAPPVEAPAEDETEVDVTALVKGSEEAKNSADKASFFSSILLKKLADLEKRVGDMDKVSQQIDSLESQFKLRNPTDNEKLEMQSIVSGPYTQKLSDYWSEKEGKYDVMDVNKKREYVLTKQNLEQDYSEPEIKKSFNIPNDDYIEEDI